MKALSRTVPASPNVLSPAEPPTTRFDRTRAVEESEATKIPASFVVGGSTLNRSIVTSAAPPRTVIVPLTTAAWGAVEDQTLRPSLPGPMFTLSV
jgi:hypothetical protein